MPKYSQRFLDTTRPTLYARREKSGPVTLHHDKEARDLACFYDLHDTKRPRHGRKWININCVRWKLEWLPDAPTKNL